MLIIPAIDIIGGKCVRLTQGDYTKVKNYDDDPIKVAQKFKAQGATLLHIIDLEGAKTGKPKNFKKITEIARKTGFQIQVGGGIRTFEDAKKILDNGIARVILGTSALKNPALINKLIRTFGADRVIVSLDAKDGIIMTKGWTEKNNLTLKKALNQLKKTGLKTLIFTDIKQDGTLKGINTQNIKKVLNKGFKIIVAGGVTNQDDIRKLEKLKVYGCIIGKALYEGKIQLPSPNNLTRRIIPCMDVRNSRVVKGINFVNLKDAGDPVKLAKYYSRMGADELVFLDIMATVENRKTLCKLVRRISENINIPFTVGGGIKSLKDIKTLLENGADKISIGSYAVENPNFVKQAAKKFGSQCIVISIDPKKITGKEKRKWEIFTNGGRTNTGIDAIKFAKQMEALGAGELLVNSLDRDGTKNGYDIQLLKAITSAVNIPVIASSGAGSKEDFLKALTEANVDGALAASLFHYGTIRIPDLKKYLLKNNVIIRI